MPEQPLVFPGYSSIQFFHSTFLSTIASEANRGTLSLTVQHLCDLREPMLPHVHQLLPTQALPREAEVSLGVPSILRILPTPHNQFTCKQKVLVGRVDLCVKLCYKSLQKPLSSFRFFSSTHFSQHLFQSELLQSAAIQISNHFNIQQFFQNCSLSKNEFKISPSKKTLSLSNMIFTFNLFFPRSIKVNLQIISNIFNHISSFSMYLHLFQNTC